MPESSSVRAEGGGRTLRQFPVLGEQQEVSVLIVPGKTGHVHIGGVFTFLIV